MSSSSPSSCPFDVIVITSPDHKAAVAARQLIISSCGDFFSSSLESPSSLSSCGGTLISTDGTIFISSCDPYGTRLGSGGGTLAALAEARETYYQINSDKISEPTVLICHAGGESSRCPTQITLGKAWTSLPLKQHQEEDEVVLNPTSLLIATLSTIFCNVPCGSVVVAASDVLLSFQHCNNNIAITSNDSKVIHFNETHGGVIGLAVPAPLSTAKNHGVFVLDDHDDDDDDDDEFSSSENASRNDDNKRNDANKSADATGEKWRLQSTYKVLQKPSIDEMISMSTPSCTFIQHDNQTIAQEKSQQEEQEEEAERMAWIDTGVITFLPDAVSTLNELSSSTLKNCTRSGLRELYHERYGGSIGGGGGNNNNPSCVLQGEGQQQLTLEEFAKIATPKICLYGDMLHALQTTSSSTRKTTISSPSHIMIG